MAGRKKRSEYSMKPAAVAARKRRAKLEAGGSKPVARKVAKAVRKPRQVRASAPTELDPLVVVTVRTLDLQNRVERMDAQMLGFADETVSAIKTLSDKILELKGINRETTAGCDTSKKVTSSIAAKKSSKAVSTANGTRPAAPEKVAVLDDETAENEDYLV